LKKAMDQIVSVAEALLRREASRSTRV